MKSTLTFLVLLTFGLLASTILDIMALHDIANDYVSRDLFSDQEVSLPADLPEWTSCSLEWGAIQFSIIFQLVLTLLVIVGLIRILRIKNLG